MNTLNQNNINSFAAGYLETDASANLQHQASGYMTDDTDNIQLQEQVNVSIQKVTIQRKQTFSAHCGGFTKGEIYNWSNPYGIRIPVIKFTPECEKCDGTGTCKSMFMGTRLPCSKCYARQGFCEICYGSKIVFNKGKPCTQCQNGMRLTQDNSGNQGQI